MATNPHVGMPISVATFSAISAAFSDIFSPSLFVGNTVEPSSSSAMNDKKLFDIFL